MRISAKAEYACVAMLELAANCADAQPVRIKAIADAQGIPPRFLVQILLQLKTAGLVASVRGAQGGYQLARPPETSRWRRSSTPSTNAPRRRTRALSRRPTVRPPWKRFSASGRNSGRGATRTRSPNAGRIDSPHRNKPFLVVSNLRRTSRECADLIPPHGGLSEPVNRNVPAAEADGFRARSARCRACRQRRRPVHPLPHRRRRPQPAHRADGPRDLQARPRRGSHRPRRQEVRLDHPPRLPRRRNRPRRFKPGQTVAWSTAATKSSARST